MLRTAIDRARTAYDNLSRDIAWADPLLILLLVIETIHVGATIWIRCS